MVKVDLKGIFRVTAKGRVYWYAWRGGPRLVGEWGSAEFLASFLDAHENLRAPNTDRFNSLVVAYRASPEYKNLATATKQCWGPWLDRIAEHFGDLRIAQFERPLKIRPIIIKWRNQWGHSPRSADMAIQVLSRVLSYAAHTLGKLSTNPTEGMRTLYRANRSEIVWTQTDIERLKQTCSPAIAHAVDLAACSGLRLSDIVRLSWSNIGDTEIVISTSKSRHKVRACIPLYDGLHEVLARIPKRATTVLTNSKGRPWAVRGLGAAFTQAKNEAGLTELHFHDLRGTAATRFYMAGLPESMIVEIMGWEPEHVSKIIKRYVGRGAVIKAAVAILNKQRTQGVKPL